MDPIVGPVKTCSKCREEWPADTEFFSPSGKTRGGGLSCYCKACSAELAQNRRDARRLEKVS